MKVKKFGSSTHISFGKSSFLRSALSYQYFCLTWYILLTHILSRIAVEMSVLSASSGCQSKAWKTESLNPVRDAGTPAQTYGAAKFALLSRASPRVGKV
ncbi:uncharacterized protein LY89DRAFT_294034 [Mollisia scopiformis]|uniref:Uncharacterized protein n=1 Tax=Mollisia scopiformis TaxID=149040 RepID=A0A194XQ94_MOLSC|nr:uncharacterized protein LY89DRAFT_294034 [Mollisia scopiformis]KUJ22331.1 hypothetical protein LY89DRAFT_294034 [Mollisia scopiformis]